jgi:hypothetical protein
MASGNAGMDRLRCRPAAGTRTGFRSLDGESGLFGGVSCARGVAISPADSPVFAPRSGSQAYFRVAVGCGTSVNRKHTTTRLRMAQVTCPECGEEVSEPSPTCSTRDAAPPAKASRACAPQSVPAQRQKTHPVTWVVTAAIIPLLCWDAWQTYKEARLKMSVVVKLGHAPREPGHVPRLDEQLPE